MRGKIAVRDGDSAFAASFDWVQVRGTFDIELWGPLGQGRFRLHGDRDRLSVTDARGATTVGLGAESFMLETLGWSIPIDALPHWVRGRYDPNDALRAVRRRADGSFAGFEQSGWAVELSRWQESALGPVPGRIVATQRDRRVVVVCKEWSFG